MSSCNQSSKKLAEPPPLPSLRRRAGIKGFRWHDLRHAWASWHVQAGTPLNVLQELGGWASYEMLLRYAHLSAEHLETLRALI
jgi:site-specific recombinase XerD